MSTVPSKPHFYLIPKDIQDTFLIRHHVLPNLGTVWHYHPEIELHYIVRGKGVRFIGDNISNFESGELLLLGRDLPHMWRCTDNYFNNNPEITAEAIVIQFLEGFLGQDFLALKESQAIVNLLEKSCLGLHIFGKTKEKIVELMKESTDAKGLTAMLCILKMLDVLSQSDEIDYITTEKPVYKSNQSEQDRLNKVINHTLKNYYRELSLEEISSVANLSPTSFCRYFKLVTKKTYYDFLLEVRINHAKRMLLDQSEATTEYVCFESGFNNRSNFFRHFKKITGLTPVEFKKKSTY